MTKDYQLVALPDLFRTATRETIKSFSNVAGGDLTPAGKVLTARWSALTRGGFEQKAFYLHWRVVVASRHVLLNEPLPADVPSEALRDNFGRAIHLVEGLLTDESFTIRDPELDQAHVSVVDAFRAFWASTGSWAPSYMPPLAAFDRSKLKPTGSTAVIRPIEAPGRQYVSRSSSRHPSSSFKLRTLHDTERVTKISGFLECNFILLSTNEGRIFTARIAGNEEAKVDCLGRGSQPSDSVRMKAGQHAVACGVGSELHSWYWRPGERIKRDTTSFRRQKSSIRLVCLSDRGLMSVDEDGLIALGGPFAVTTYKEAEPGVSAMAASKDWLAFGKLDGHVRIYDLFNYEEVASRHFESAVTSVQLAPTGLSILVTTEDSLSLWNPDSGECTLVHRLTPGSPSNARMLIDEFAPTNVGTLIVADRYGWTEYDTKRGLPKTTVSFGSGTSTAIGIGATGTSICRSTLDGSVEIWGDIHRDELRATLGR